MWAFLQRRTEFGILADGEHTYKDFLNVKNEQIRYLAHMRVAKILVKSI